MEMSAVDQSWYAVHVRSNFERIAATILEGKNFEVYLPTYRRPRRWSDRIKEIECPLFPGYVFCRFDINSRLPILTTPGVRSIVGNGKVPAAIAEEEIGAVQRITSSGSRAMPWPFLSSGQRVMVRKGAFAGMEGILLSSSKRHRLVVSISLLQRSVAIELDADMICATQPRMLHQPGPAIAV